MLDLMYLSLLSSVFRLLSFLCFFPILYPFSFLLTSDRGGARTNEFTYWGIDTTMDGWIDTLCVYACLRVCGVL